MFRRSQTSTIGALTSWWMPSISAMKSRSFMLRRAPLPAGWVRRRWHSRVGRQIIVLRLPRRTGLRDSHRQLRSHHPHCLDRQPCQAHNGRDHPHLARNLLGHQGQFSYPKRPLTRVTPCSSTREPKYQALGRRKSLFASTAPGPSTRDQVRIRGCVPAIARLCSLAFGVSPRSDGAPMHPRGTASRAAEGRCGPRDRQMVMTCFGGLHPWGDPAIRDDWEKVHLAIDARRRPSGNS